MNRPRFLHTVGRLVAVWGVIAVLGGCAATAQTNENVQSFDTDPGWEIFGEHAMGAPVKQTVQDFGWRASNKAGGAAAGEVGGTISRSVTPAWYAKKIPTKTLGDRLHASGRFSVTRTDSSSCMLFGFFNENSRGWRANNYMVMRFSGEGGGKNRPESKRDPYSWVFYEYGTRHWRVGGGATFEGIYQTTEDPPLKSDGAPHDWSLDYDPDGADGLGEITFTLDGKTFKRALTEGHKAEGAEFNRFGLLNAQVAGSSMDVYFDDLTINGKPEDLSQDPDWEGHGNEITFADRDVRPYHDFNWSKTNNAGGKSGEMAVTMWRNESPAYYGDPIEPVTLDEELYAEGRLAFTGAGSDSGVFLGWFNAEAKRNKTDPDAAHKGQKASPQTSYLAIGIEGPSRIGHYFHPYYAPTDGKLRGRSEAGPIIRPDGQQRRWTLHYDPQAADGRGRITVTLDDEKVELDLRAGARESGATFDRFGFFNTQSGGHYVKVFVDDLQCSGM